MSKGNLIAAASVLLIAVFGLISFETKTEASRKNLGDSCKNVSFEVWNWRSGDIEIKKVKYYNQNESRWQTEDVYNTTCRRGASCRFGWDNLRDSEGDNLTKIIFVYKDVNGSQTLESPTFTPSSPQCRADKQYGDGQNWQITGNAGNSESDSTSDKCKRVEFKVTNGRDEEIEISKVKFFNRNSGNWKTEGVKNVNCAVGATCTLSQNDAVVGVGNADNFDINLSDANGDDVTKVIFIYKYKAGGRGANWSDLIESKTFEPTSPRCTEGKVFGTGQLWTIGSGSESNASSGSNSRSAPNNSGGSGTQTTATSPPPPANNRQRGRRNAAQANSPSQPTTNQSSAATATTEQSSTAAATGGNRPRGRRNRNQTNANQTNGQPSGDAPEQKPAPAKGKGRRNKTPPQPADEAQTPAENETEPTTETDGSPKPKPKRKVRKQIKP